METKIVDDFLPSDVADRLGTFLSRVTWQYGWRSHEKIEYSHWNFDLTKTDISNGLDISDRLPDIAAKAWNYIKTNHLPDYRLIRCYANAHTYGVEGYPHRDSAREQDVTVVVYMNKQWHREWAGETVIFDKDEISVSTMPKFNRAVIFNGNQWHCARGVTRICPEQRRTLMFKCARMDADTDRDNLQTFLEEIGATIQPHKSLNLARHLLNTYDLLMDAKAEKSVCLAGGAHSVFGTNAFKYQSLKFDEIGRLENVIGTEATRLVKLFATIDRPTVLENGNRDDLGIDEQDFQHLRLIEAANLHEQYELKQWPKLLELWQNKRSEEK